MALHKKLLELVNEFNNVAKYKINIQKSVAFLYTNNELSERETKKTIPFTLAMYIFDAQSLFISLLSEITFCFRLKRLVGENSQNVIV